MTVRIIDEYRDIPFLKGAEIFKDMCRKAGILREYDEDKSNNN